MEHIALDLTPSGSGLLSRCHVSQYDIGRQVCFDLYNVGAVFTLAGTETIKLKIRRPDGVAVEDNITNTSSTYVVWTSASGDCDAEGNAECELIVTDNGTRIGSANFIMEVEPDPYNGNVNIKSASGAVASFSTDIEDNLVECKATITPYQGAGVDKITIINSKTAPVKSTTPYLIKETPSGNGELDKLIGGTVAVNQVITIPSNSKSKTENGVTFTDNRDGSYTIQTDNNGATANTYISLDSISATINHKYFVCGCPSGGSDSSYYFYANGLIGTEREYGNGIIGNQVETRSCTPVIYIKQGAIITTPIIFKPQVIDLTAMFGSTIADYVYTLENS